MQSCRAWSTGRGSAASCATRRKPRGQSDNEVTEDALRNVSLRTFVSQQDIANMALYLASPFGRTISGQAISIDGGMEGLL